MLRRYFPPSASTIVLLLLLGGFALRLHTAMDPCLHEWDERYHALVAKHLVQHPLIPTLYENPILPYDFNNWAGNHIWLSKPPLPLWFISGSICLFGNNELAIRIPSIIVSTLSILLTFKIAQVLFNNKISLLAAFLHAVHGMLIELAGGRISSDHMETFFVFFIELAILMGILSVIKERRNLFYLCCCGVFTGCAILSKFLPALIVFPVWFSFALLFRKQSFGKILVHFALLVAVTLTISLPWFVYISSAFPLEGRAMIESLTNPLSTVIQEHSEPPLFYLHNIRIVFGEIIYIPLLWLFYRAYKERKRIQNLPLLLWIMIPLIIFSLAETKRHTYLLIAAPALFIMTSYFFYWLIDYRNRQLKHQWILNLILFFLIALPVRYSIERIKPFAKREKDTQWVTELKQLNERRITKGVLFNCDRPIEAMFYTDLTVYSTMPDSSLIRKLSSEGYTVLIYKPSLGFRVQGLGFRNASWPLPNPNTLSLYPIP